MGNSACRCNDIDADINNELDARTTHQMVYKDDDCFSSFENKQEKKPLKESKCENGSSVLNKVEFLYNIKEKQQIISQLEIYEKSNINELNDEKGIKTNERFLYNKNENESCISIPRI